MPSIRQLISALNSLGVGELPMIVAKIDEARTVARAREDLTEIAGFLDEARQALLAGDLRTYRKRIERAVATLGHSPGE